MSSIKFRRQVSEAIWNEESSKWHLKVLVRLSIRCEPVLTFVLQIQDPDTLSTITDDCDVLIQATGTLNNWKWPKIPGLQDFQGKLMHSASWDESYDYKVCRLLFFGCFHVDRLTGQNRCSGRQWF